jgi:hypothetical protein
MWHDEPEWTPFAQSHPWSTTMNRRGLAGLILGATLGLTLASAQAGPCTQEIAQFEAAVRASKSTPGAGPGAPQSIGAQLEHQPTPQSVKEAEARAQTGFEAVLARAKALDAEGNRDACMKALSDAKLIYFQ